MIWLLGIVVVLLAIVLERLYLRLRRLEQVVRELGAELDYWTKQGPMLALLVCGLLGAGCQPEQWVPPADATPRPGQSEAMAVVWTGVYGKTSPPPRVLYVTGDALNCSGTAWHDPWWDACVGGVTVDGVSYVAWPEGATFSSTGFAHELRHTALGYHDPFHLDASWTTGVVDRANAALKDAGL